MKKLFYLFLCLLPPFIYSCSDTPPLSIQNTTYRLPGAFSNLEIVVVDSCEYIYGHTGNGNVLTHKGNCKFCQIRNK